MKKIHTYHVEYHIYGNGVRGIDVLASSKVEAYDKAVYEMIPEIEGEHPYSAWVNSVTYQNGNCKMFNTFEGNPY